MPGYVLSIIIRKPYFYKGGIYMFWRNKYKKITSFSNDIPQVSAELYEHMSTDVINFFEPRIY